MGQDFDGFFAFFFGHGFILNVPIVHMMSLFEKA